MKKMDPEPNYKIMKKSRLLETIQEMPEEFSVDELMERLVIIQKIEEGQQQIKEGKFLSEEEAKKKMEKWLK
jgi:predicted transcriptional regulator